MNKNNKLAPEPEFIESPEISLELIGASAHVTNDDIILQIAALMAPGIARVCPDFKEAAKQSIELAFELNLALIDYCEARNER